MKKIISIMILSVCMLICLVIRHYLILELPIFAYVDYINDDELMVEQANNIKQGNWLGVYGYNTLLKGPVFPLYLAVLSILKLPYLLTTTLVYAVSICLFVYSIKDIIKNKFALFTVFLVMLFNPIMFSIDFQRVYRNSLTPSLAIMIISFLNIAFLNRNNEKIRWYVSGIIFGSLIFPFFYYIREDSIWIVPFIVFYFIIIALNVIITCLSKHVIKIEYIVKLFLLVLPLITLMLFNVVVGEINNKHYGDDAINMSDIDSLQAALHAILIVKTEDINSGASNPREKIRRLYVVSPTLNSMKDNFERLQNIISGRENGDVGDAMFMWAFLETISSSGYNTFEAQDKVFNDIANEINQAIEDGKLETQDLTPIFADAAYYKFNTKSMVQAIYKAFLKINDYKSFGIMDTYGSLYSSEYFESRIRIFLEITNDRMLLNNEPRSWNMYGELVKESQQDYINDMQPKINILNNITDVYDVVSDVIIIVGYASYAIITVVLIIKAIKKDAKELFDSWVVLSGIIGATFTLCFGVAYTSITKGPVTIPFYLMSGYILNIAFGTISILVVINLIMEKVKVSKNKPSNKEV